MNVELLRRVADRIELEGRFDLNYFCTGGRDGTTTLDLVNVCSTTGCVAGWVCAVEGLKLWSDSQIEEAARDALWLINKQARRLFYAKWGSLWAELAEDFGWERDEFGAVAGWEQITSVQAAKVLRMIADGEVTL